MDEKLKEDIHETFFNEYYTREKQNSGGIVKAARKVFDKADEVSSKIGISGPGALLVASIILFVYAPPVGITMLCAWMAAGVANVAGMVKEGKRAATALEADIENGKLTAAYHAVLDKKERELSETAELYKAQRAQLPPKGAAVEAFANAGKDAVVAAPAPAAPASQPKP